MSTNAPLIQLVYKYIRTSNPEALEDFANGVLQVKDIKTPETHLLFSKYCHFLNGELNENQFRAELKVFLHQLIDKEYETLEKSKSQKSF